VYVINILNNEKKGQKLFTGRKKACWCPGWVLFSLLKCVDLLFHTYLLGILLLSTYLAALLCQDAVTQVQRVQ
jgi:hypothetical protein